MSTSLEEANKAVVERVFSTWNEQDKAGFADCHAEDVVIHGADDVNGLENLLTVQWGFFDAFSDTRLTLEECLAEGDLVSLRYTANGTHDGTFEGLAPTGTEVEFTAMGMVRVVDGKITDKWVQLDMLSLLAQLDAIESPVV
ncbi:ester cyclase [Haloarchaeobius sp. DYHT-AS-18]|uniref:ester cyclase n=1 Tax=Haloarchaeobius sp. DYHT-AS-18 TaxID=3446117 RepID=UPI003EBCA135